MKDKIALFCNVPKEHVFTNMDVPSLYEIPLILEDEHLAQAACSILKLPCPEPDLADWRAMVDAMKSSDKHGADRPGGQIHPAARRLLSASWRP